MRVLTSGRPATSARRTSSATGWPPTPSTSWAASCRSPSATTRAGRRVSPACTPRSTSSTRRAPAARGPCCATPAAPTGSPTPGAGERTRRWRLTAPAGRRSSPAAGAPPPPPGSAATSRSSTTTRRPTWRACRRSSASWTTPTCGCCWTAATSSWPAGGRGGRRPAGGGGGAPGDWSERIYTVHVKDVRLDVLAGVKAERADTLTAWRRGLFCALGQGDVDLPGFCAALAERGYDGWLVVEQDRVLADLNGSFEGAAAEQVANREWLREHAGW